MVGKKVLLAFAIVVIAATIIISVLASQLLLQSGTDAKGGSFEMSGINVFPKNLVLRGIKADTYKDPYLRHLLIDDETMYPNPSQKNTSFCAPCYVHGDFMDSLDRYDWNDGSMFLNASKRTMYNVSFVYAKPAVKEYYILGMPTVSLTFNVSTTGTLYEEAFELWFNVSLYRLSIGVWDKVIDFGCAYWNITQIAPETVLKFKDHGFWFSHSVDHPIWIGPNEKIALRITVTGRSVPPVPHGGNGVALYHMFRMDKPNQFVVDLPIVEP
jgi:hypothetical protein